MDYPLRLFLIGPRGSGKSTVAKLLATRLDFEFADSDLEVEQSAGKSIAKLFQDDGEQVFRDLETETLARLVQRDQVVIALGGGAVVREENRRLIADRGPVVFLSASVNTLVARLSGDEGTVARRPRLTALDARAEMQSVLAARLPIYRSCASWEVDTEGRSPADVVGEIVQRLHEEAPDFPPTATEA